MKIDDNALTIKLTKAEKQILAISLQKYGKKQLEQITTLLLIKQDRLITKIKNLKKTWQKNKTTI